MLLIVKDTRLLSEAFREGVPVSQSSEGSTPSGVPFFCGFCSKQILILSYTSTQNPSGDHCVVFTHWNYFTTLTLSPLST